VQTQVNQQQEDEAGAYVVARAVIYHEVIIMR
jgi:hypothetical protein